MSVLDEILRTKLDEVTLLHQPGAREAIRTAALAAGAGARLRRRRSGATTAGSR